jgi:hypothetical protein
VKARAIQDDRHMHEPPTPPATVFLVSSILRTYITIVSCFNQHVIQKSRSVDAFNAHRCAMNADRVSKLSGIRDDKEPIHTHIARYQEQVEYCTIASS